MEFTSTDLNEMGLSVDHISYTPNPQTVAYMAMHQDYSEEYVVDEMLPSGYTLNACPVATDPKNTSKDLDEKVAGLRVIDHCLKYRHFGPCYDPETEILTENGWIKFPDLKSEKVAQWNFDGSIEFVGATKVILDYEGEMLNFGSKYIDMALTPDHKMVISHRKKNGSFVPYYWQKADKAYGRSFKIPVSGNYYQESEIFGFNESALIGFFLGDGVSRFNNDDTVKFRLKKSRKIDFLLSLGFKVEPMKSNYFKVHVSVQLKNFLIKLTDGKVKTLNLSDGLKLNFLGLMAGLRNSDGTKVRGDLSFSYDSTSLGLLDTLQAIAHLNGIHANISENGKPLNENHSVCKRICFREKTFVRFEPTLNRTRDYCLSRNPYRGKVYCVKVPSGMVMVRRGNKVFISGNCEHPQIVLGVKGFPHTTMQQLRTHRTGISFDCQSGRYTGKRLANACLRLSGCDNVWERLEIIKEVFWIRPEGHYRDRFSSGVDWEYSESTAYTRLTAMELNHHFSGILDRYHIATTEGMPPEMARDLYIPYSVRQNFVMSVNLRSAMHLLEMRFKKDAELECQWFCQLLYDRLHEWAPEIMEWWMDTRGKKNMIAP